MHPDEPVMHSFVVRIWLESSADDDWLIKWRGQITHLPGNESQSFKDLNRVVEFILPYLKDSATPVSAGSRLRQWLGGQWRRLGGSHRL